MRKLHKPKRDFIGGCKGLSKIHSVVRKFKLEKYFLGTIHNHIKKKL